MWILKAGPEDESDLDPPEYLNAWTLKEDGNADGVEWTTRQANAHRFADRNEAARLAETFPINAYCDTVRVVRLRAKVVRPTVNETPKEDRDHECG